MLRRNTLTQKSKLKKNRTYFSNFKLLMPMLGYSCTKTCKEKQEVSYLTLQGGSKNQRAHIFSIQGSPALPWV